MSGKEGKALDALELADDAVDHVIKRATELQMATEDQSLDELADRAKNMATGARDAIDDLQEAIEAPGEHEAADAIAQEAAKVEAELKAVAHELHKAQSARVEGKPATLQRAVSRAKTTEEAVAELEALAKKKASKNIQIIHILRGLVAFQALIAMFIIYRFNLAGKELAIAGALGLLWGFLMAAIYHINVKWKAERNQRLAMIPGAKGMQTLLHHIPTWITFRETEKMEWLNRILEKVWPYYDEAICAQVKAEVEPLLNMYKPPGLIKRIYFKKLTMGDTPFRVEGIRVDESEHDQVLIDIDYRWSSDANIFLAIEVLLGGSATRMVPKVADLAVSGTLRVILKPLLPEIPGFGAATVSLLKPPVVKFHLDFGAAFGGSITAGAIVAWLDPFLRSTIAGMLVWPKRLVIPILDESVTGPLDDVFLRHKGALQVDVVEAKDIPRMDRVGTADPFVEVYTDAGNVEKTSVKKNTLKPVWNERLWMLVQEPATQFAYVTVNDVDFVNVKELFRVNVVKGAAGMFGAKELIGRSMLNVSEFAATPGVEVDKWVPLGLGEFSDEDGCGGGRGELRVKVTYWPLEKMGGHSEAPFGAVVVTLVRCEDLAATDLPIFSSDPYVKFTCNKETQKSPVVYNELNPKWLDAKYDWFKVPRGAQLDVEVWDYDRFSGDELLGKLSINLLSEVASAPGGDITKTYQLTDVPTEWIRRKAAMGEAVSDVRPSTITLRLQWIPFTLLPTQRVEK